MFATFGVQKQLATSGEFISGSSLISIVHRLLYFYPLFYGKRKSDLFLQINNRFCFQIEQHVLKTMMSKWTYHSDFSFIDKKGFTHLVKLL